MLQDCHTKMLIMYRGPLVKYDNSLRAAFSLTTDATKSVYIPEFRF